MINRIPPFTPEETIQYYIDGRVPERFEKYTIKNRVKTAVEAIEKESMLSKSQIDDVLRKAGLT